MPDHVVDTVDGLRYRWLSPLDLKVRGLSAAVMNTDQYLEFHQIACRFAVI